MTFPQEKKESSSLSSKTIRLFSSNLLRVNPSPEGILGEIKQGNFDLLVLQEFSSFWVNQFKENRLYQEYPYVFQEVRDDSFGIAFFSKYPFLEKENIDFEGVPLLRVALKIPQQEKICIFYNVHTLPPRLASYTRVWKKQHEFLQQKLRQEVGPLLVAGDFNATQYSRPYQDLLSLGFRCAFREKGKGFYNTFPNGLFPLPPIRLDHVFLRGRLFCKELKLGKGRSSDHRPICVELRF